MLTKKLIYKENDLPQPVLNDKNENNSLKKPILILSYCGYGLLGLLTLIAGLYAGFKILQKFGLIKNEDVNSFNNNHEPTLNNNSDHNIYQDSELIENTNALTSNRLETYDDANSLSSNYSYDDYSNNGYLDSDDEWSPMKSVDFSSKTEAERIINMYGSHRAEDLNIVSERHEEFSSRSGVEDISQNNDSIMARYMSLLEDNVNDTFLSRENDNGSRFSDWM